MSSASPVPISERLYSIEELVELRRNTLRYARAFPPGDERNRHRLVAVSLRTLFRRQNWLRSHTVEGAISAIEQAGRNET